MYSEDNCIKISSIIPIFNAEKYLDKCLSSIVNQTLEDIEIICINDGSTDNSLEIIKNYAYSDDRIKIINSTNNGQGSARNKALNEAKGEFISFVDADDWIELNTYEQLYSIAKSNNLDMLFFQMINYINSSDKYIKTDLYDYKCFLERFNVSEIFSSDDIQDFLFEIAVCPVSKLYNRHFLQKNNLKFPEGIIFEDNIFFYNAILDANKMSFLNKHLYYRRRHNESVTQNITEKAFDIVTVTNSMLDIFKERDLYDIYKKQIINHTFSMIIEWFFKSQLIYCNDFFLIIKHNFKGCNELKSDFMHNLNNTHNNIFNLISNNCSYLDFISQYNLSIVEYSNKIDSKDFNYKVSVIIPIYNNEKIIHRTLMSILNQSLGNENIEIILINDKSTDNTSKIIDKYALEFDNIKSIHLNENTGSSGTPRNIGISEASADYILFLDHDDFLEINAIEKLYNEIKRQDCDLVFGTYAIVNNENFKKIKYPNEKHGFFNNINENERFVSFPPPSIWTKLFNKKFIIKNNILFPPFLGEDAVFMTKVFLKANGISYMHDSLICFHDLNSNSLTNNVSFDYLMECLFSEKYLLNLYKNINKEYYFKFRCEGNLDFFLTQFLRSNLTIKEFNNIYSMLFNFFKKCESYYLVPNIENNKILFEYFLNNDMDSIIDFKNDVGKQISDFIIPNDKNIFYKIFEKIKKNFNNFFN